MPELSQKAAEIRRTLGAFVLPGDIIEFRTEKSDRDDLKYRGTCSGYFDTDHLDEMAVAAAAFDGRTHVWMTINPVLEQVQTRCANGVAEKAKSTTGDEDIARLRTLMIDCDPKRPADTSSSDEQHDAALAKAGEIMAFLAERGFPDGVLADSGNGGHLTYFIDLPNDAESVAVLKALLEGLHAQFSDDVVKVDRTTFNPARLIKIWGTKSVKGDDHPKFPHRYSRLISAPQNHVVVPAETLRGLAAALTPPVPSKAPAAPRNGLKRPAQAHSNDQAHSNGHSPQRTWDMDDFISKYGIATRSAQPYMGGTKWQLDCPFDPSHAAPDAFLSEAADGALGFHCSHDSCTGRAWREFRLLYEPDAYDPKPAPAPITARPLITAAPVIPPLLQGGAEAAKDESAEAYDPKALTDEEVLGMAREQAEFAALYDDPEAGTKATVAALCAAVAHFTGPNAARVKTLVGASPLIANYWDEGAAKSDLKSGVKSAMAGLDENGWHKHPVAAQAIAEATGLHFSTDIAPPLPADLKTPWEPGHSRPAPGTPWSLDLQGGVIHTALARGTLTTESILAAPIQVVGRAKHHEDGTEMVTVRWMDGGNWSEATAPRADFVNAQKLIALANSGLGVHTGNAARLSAYIAHLLSYHQFNIPVSTVVSATGWSKIQGDDIFVFGPKLIVSKGAKAPKVSFVASNQEIKAATDNLSFKGTLEGWREVMALVTPYPVVAFGIMASLTAPFVTHLDMPLNPVVDYSGTSTGGKTTTLRVAASAWGLPHDKSGLIRSWNATPTFVEKLATSIRDLPLFLDESHLAKPELRQDVTYSYANGSGRGRGNKEGGVQTTAHFRGVLFCGGEARLTDASTHDGAIARVISFNGSPFGGRGPKQKTAADAIIKGIMANYGHAGPALLEAFQKSPEGIANRLRERQEEYVALLSAVKEDAAEGINADINPLDARLIQVYAAIGAVGTWASNQLGLGWEVKELLVEAYKRGRKERKVDNAQLALEAAVDHALGHRPLYEVKGDNRDFAPITDGKFFTGEKESSNELPPVLQIAWKIESLKAILAARGYSYAATIAQWNEKGWLVTDKDRTRPERTVRVSGNPIKTILLSPAAMRLATGDDGNAYDEYQAAVDQADDAQAVKEMAAKKAE